jgi:hypothetical protein
LAVAVVVVVVGGGDVVTIVTVIAVFADVVYINRGLCFSDVCEDMICLVLFLFLFLFLVLLASLSFRKE